VPDRNGLEAPVREDGGFFAPASGGSPSRAIQDLARKVRGIKRLVAGMGGKQRCEMTV